MYSRTILAAAAAGTEPVEVQLHEVESKKLNIEVPVSVLLPAGCDPEQPLPLLISLDGGIGDRMSLVERQELYTDLFGSGLLPPMIVVSFSGGSNQFYHGGWEDWITSELPDWAHTTFGAKVGAENLLLTGMSGGGYGALKVGLKNPHRFKAIAALEPTIFASLEWPEEHTRARWWMPNVTAEAIWGSPFDSAKFLADHAPNIVCSDAENIRASSMQIYLEVGDEDLIGLHDGAEFLHRVLWDHDIRHEFHLVRWADHAGQSINDRLIESHTFLAAALTGEKSEPRNLPLTEGEEAFINYVLTGGPQRGEAPPADATQADQERALSFMSRLYQPMRDMAVSKDPAMSRAYGEMPR